jgi:hypothetical protein
VSHWKQRAALTATISRVPEVTSASTLTMREKGKHYFVKRILGRKNKLIRYHFFFTIRVMREGVFFSFRFFFTFFTLVY